MSPIEKAHLDSVRIGAITSMTVDDATVRKDYKDAVFKKNLGRAVLGATAMIAGGVAVGAIGGQAATNTYIGMTASHPELGPAQRSVAALAEVDQVVIIEKKMQQLLPGFVKQRLERAVAANALVRPKVKSTATAHLDVHLDAIVHEQKHNEHFLVADATAKILSASGECLYTMYATGCSYRKEGRPQTAPAKSAAELLTAPGMLDRHLDSVAGGIAESFAQELADLFESLDPNNQ